MSSGPNGMDFDVTQHELLSTGQLGHLAKTINSGGGFSVKAAGADRGRRATSGYMVGQPGMGMDYPVGDIHPGHIASYAIARRDALAKPDHYLGGWQGEDPVRGSLDVAKRFPTGQRGSRSTAKLSAAKSNQEGIGIVDAQGDYGGTINNPNYRKERGHGYRQPTLKDASWAFPATPEGQPRAQSSRRSTFHGSLPPRGEGRPAGPFRKAQ